MSWTTTAERGSILGIRALIWSLRLFGRRAAGVIGLPFLFYFFVTGARARAASARYLARVAATARGRAALGRQPDLYASWLHFRAFGDSLLDRLCFWGGLGDRFRIDSPARPELLRVHDSRRGAIVIGAHLGSIDVLRAAAFKKGLPIHLLTFRDNARKINAVIKSLEPDLDLRAIHVDAGSIQSILQLKECIDRGEIVAILGDRAELASRKRIGRTSFLGAPADFPLGPLHIAHALGCPVYMLFAFRSGRDAYEVHFEKLAERIVLDRRQRERDLAAWLERYVRRLEFHCLSVPLQWFNFYDFWGDEKAHGTVSASAPAATTDDAHLAPGGRTIGGTR